MEQPQEGRIVSSSAYPKSTLESMLSHAERELQDLKNQRSAVSGGGPTQRERRRAELDADIRRKQDRIRHLQDEIKRAS